MEVLVSPPATLHVSKHPAVRHKLAILRDERTEPKKFREIVRELSWLLGYEALADARVRPLTITTPIEEMQAEQLGDRIGLVPILRAGLGMVDAMLELMPTAEVWHLGLFRDERTLRPVEYYNKLPDSASVDLCLILDPMLATGGSATAAIEVLKRWGAVKPVRIKLVNLIAAPEGVAAVAAAHPDVEIHCAALDRQLNDKGYIMPGPGRCRRSPVRDGQGGLSQAAGGLGQAAGVRRNTVARTHRAPSDTRIRVAADTAARTRRVEKFVAPARPREASATSPISPRFTIAKPLPVTRHTTAVSAVIPTPRPTKTRRTVGESAGTASSWFEPAMAQSPIPAGAPRTAARPAAATLKTSPKIARNQPPTSGCSPNSRIARPSASSTAAAITSITRTVLDAMTRALWCDRAAGMAMSTAG